MATATQIVRRALITAGIIDPEEETPDFYSSEGLVLLNELLAEWSALGIYIPYTTTLTFNVTQGDYTYVSNPPIAQYFEGNIIGSDNLLSSLNPPLNEKQFNVLNFSAPQDRPQNIYISTEQYADTNGDPASLIYIYPPPDGAYTMKLKVKQYLTKAVEFQEYTGIPDFYFKPLRYELGGDLADYFQIEVTPKFELTRMRVVNKLKASVPKDYSVNTPNIFVSRRRRYRPWGGYVG